MYYRVFKNFLRIIRSYYTPDYETRIRRLEISKSIIRDYILELKIRKECKGDIYKKEIEYVNRNGITFFPYKQLKKSPVFESGIDSGTGFPYVVHKRKKLFFPKSYDIHLCQEMYKSYIDSECLLGGDFREKSPHQYQTDKFKIEKGDILVDVGCAEALLSLDVIDEVSKVYLIESDKDWIPALQTTFKDYTDKVVIINKYVSVEDTDSTITLKTILKDDLGKSMFIKMDIEGAEVDVLKGSIDFLGKAKNIKIASCTYHNQHDADSIENLYKAMGYSYEYSDGYVIFFTDPNQKYPYFRHGVIRGWK